MRTFTNSSIQCSKTCLRKFYLRHVLRLRRDREATPLRLGSAYHWGQELRALGDPDFADHAVAGYDLVPEWADAYEWAVERETVRALLLGYAWRYQGDEFEVLEVESKFALGRMAGKIDRILRMPDQRILTGEYKTTSDDISPSSDYWLMLRYDWQPSTYVIAARQRGYPAEGAMYDVVRKPSIHPVQIPELDDKGKKIVLDKDGVRQYNKNGTPKQVGDADAGWYVAGRMETPEEYGARLLNDICARPDFYLQRREVPRTDEALERFLASLNGQMELLDYCEERGIWTENMGKMTCDHCEFKSLCTGGVMLSADDPTPSGYVKIEVDHPELEE